MGFVDDILSINECGETSERVNNYINDEVLKRRMQLSADKCVIMHVNSKSNVKECKDVKIDEWEVKKVKDGEKYTLVDSHKGKTSLKTVENHLYLGDIVESSGSNHLNVMSRVTKGKAIVRDIVHILEGTFFGSHFFEALMLMRESMLVSVLTNNLEVSFNIKSKELKYLDRVDLQLLREGLKVSSKAPRSLILLSLGAISIEYILKKNASYIYTIFLQKMILP